MIRAWFKTSAQLRLMHSKSTTMHCYYIMRGRLYILSFGLSEEQPPVWAAVRAVSDMHLVVGVVFPFYFSEAFLYAHTAYVCISSKKNISICVSASETCVLPASSTCLMAVKRFAASKCKTQNKEAQPGGWISNYFRCIGSRSAESH